MHNDSRVSEQIQDLNRDKGLGYLSYAGLLPVRLPEGTRVVMLPDMHVPAHDKRTVWAVTNFLFDFKPHILIFVGDVADIFGLSRYPKPPRVVNSLQEEVASTRRVVDSLVTAAGASHTFYIVGNHEERTTSYLTTYAPQLASLLSHSTRESLMAFHSLLGYSTQDRVTFIYDLMESGGKGGGILINDDVEINHGLVTRQKPGASPLAASDKVGRSKVHGHTHRFATFARYTLTKDIRGMELGHLADPTHPYLGYANLLNNWHQGFGVGTILDGTFHMQPIPIKRIRLGRQTRAVFTYGGKTYRAPNR